MRPALVLLAACGRIGFDAAGDPRLDADSSSPPVAMVRPAVDVRPAGVSDLGFEADGTHLVFVDHTPGMNGDLVVFREGEGGPTLEIDVSHDDGVTWEAFVLGPTNTTGINAMGACQDTVLHAFHVAWLDTSQADQYARLVPSYVGGRISGFTIAANFPFYDDFADSPGPRDLAEIVDASGVHRLAFAGTANQGTTGRYKLAVTSSTAGLQPGAQSDWTKATDPSVAADDDQLLPNSYATADLPPSYLISIGSNLGGGPTTPFVVLAGLPADRDLFAWAITPTGDRFSIGAQQTVSSNFGGGTGDRHDASLSLASAPDGTTWFVYSEDATSPSPGVHVGTVDTSGVLSTTRVPLVAGAAARHAVIATDSASRPAVLYADGAGAIVGTLLFDNAWLPVAQLGTQPTPAAAWAVTAGWKIGNADVFGIYTDAGVGAATRLLSVAWQ